MIQVAPGTKVYLACRPVSMRYGFDGLVAQVASVLNADPFSGHLFLFRSKRADYLKVLYWDGTGLCLFTKRLHQSRFIWQSLRGPGGTVMMTRTELAMLIDGIDWRSPERTWKPSIAG